MDNPKNKIRMYLYFLVIITISFYLSLREIPTVIDDYNYLNYVSNGGLILFSNITNFSFYIVSEPLWLFINYLLGLLFEPVLAVRVIIFVSVFITLFALGKMTQYSLISVFFFVIIDQLVKNNIVHLRQGLALSVFLLGLSLKGKWRHILLLSPFIHVSFWFSIIFYIYELSLKKLSINFKMLFFSLFSIIVALSLPFIADFLGDRRATSYSFSTPEDASGAAFIWWSLFLVVYLVGVGKNRISKLSIYGLIFYLITYFSLDFSARIFENFLALILVSTINSNSLWRYILLSLLFFYALLTSFPSGPMIFNLY
ncbi:EpsG family protein [Bacillus fonticola]|uniref:EpsG family protein n=1 Tax=Bacillus fonticola TaxID=2728853 RepID=UPI001473ADD2|nr:EpsG family protein [Bacillus fonticola]